MTQPAPDTANPLATDSPGAASQTGPERTASKAPAKVELSVQLDADLIRQMSRLTTDPSKVIEVALRQWLAGTRTESDSLARPLPPNPPVPPKGEWND